MVIYLYGPDAYRKRQKLDDIVAKYKEKHSDLTIEHFTLDDDKALAALRDFITAQSLFGGSKLAVINNPEETKELAEILKSAIGSKSTNLIVLADKKLGKDFKFLLADPVSSQGFEELTSSQIANFIKKEAEQRSVKLTPALINTLIRVNGSDTWSIINELEKMALGGQPEYEETVPDFFGLLKQLTSPGVPASKLAVLTWLLESEEPAKVFNILAAFIGTAAGKIKMADYDVAIKSGKLDYAEALVDSVIG